MRINEIFGGAPIQKPFGRKGVEDHPKNLSLTRLSPEEEEQLVFARHAKNENEYAEYMNPVHTINSDPPELHRRREHYDNILRQRYRKWKGMGLLEMSVTEAKDTVVTTDVFPPPFEWNGEEYETVISVTAKVYKGSDGTLETPPDPGGMDIEIDSISRDHPTEKELPQQVIDMVEEWFENNNDKVQEIVNNVPVDEPDFDYMRDRD